MSLAPELLARFNQVLAEHGQPATIRWPAPGTDPEDPPDDPATPLAAAVVNVFIAPVRKLIEGVTVFATDSEIVVSSDGLSAPIVPGVTVDLGDGNVLTVVHAKTAGVSGSVVVYEALARSASI